MGRSQNMGKAIAELTPDELRRERHRCASMIAVFGKGPAVKGLKKRLHELDRRISREDHQKAED